MDERDQLSRFISAQEGAAAGIYADALREIRNGRKRTHWMWYVFPQLRGLGHSGYADFYGIRGLEEARAYLADPVLGRRLREITEALLDLETNDATAVMGRPDDMKLKSCMTLFAHAAEDDPRFRAVLLKFFGGAEDERTLSMLEEGSK